MRLFRKKKKYDYITFFDRFSKYAVDAANFLKQVLDDLDHASLKGQVDTMHEIERAADNEKRLMLEKLIDEFLPPFDKEDIIDLSHKIDDVIDSIDEVLITYYTYHIHVATDEALELTNIIRQATIEMNRCLASLDKFRKSNDIFDHINNVNNLKSDGEKLYKVIIAGIFISGDSDRDAFGYTEIYKKMRRCYLNCKQVTNLVEKIVMKNL